MTATKTVLVVDDDLHIRRTAELKLRAAGLNVITAKNGCEGIDRIRRERPDAVITDITMPEVDGKGLVEATNPLKARRKFLTIVLTARIVPGEMEWIGKMTDTIFMEKPFSPTRLLEAVEAYFETADEG